MVSTCCGKLFRTHGQQLLIIQTMEHRIFLADFYFPTIRILDFEFHFRPINTTSNPKTLECPTFT